ncbi:MAG: T9SS type A sorting domain-containing protein [Chitinophagales bacterium]|nr:T9SS type A sorting domain-containing protein [Chitinophagales bacterium]
MLKKYALVLLVFATKFSIAQTYTSYFKGDTADVSTNQIAGTLLAGGATDNDEAMSWFLKRADGGDVVVIRANGDGAYNDYLYSQLGVNVNSVETIVIPSVSAANNTYVSTQIKNAEALFITGGDQYDYVKYWKDTPVEDAINALINSKHVTVGGTSAGMAIQGDAYFSAQNGTVTSQQAMNNPYGNLVKIGYHDFISNPVLKNTITDTHYDNPDRRGRQTTFLARLMTDYGFRPYGIASEEYTAVCIDENNIAHVYGYYPDYDDYAYFIQANCIEPNEPETCVAGQPLSWDRMQQAVKVYKVAGTTDGSHYFDLNDWKSFDGSGTWDNWWVADAEFNFIDEAIPANCTIETAVGEVANSFHIFPNPADDFIVLDGIENNSNQIIITDVLGRNVFEMLLDKLEVTNDVVNGRLRIDVSEFPSGIYFLRMEMNKKIYAAQFVKE